MPQFRIAHPAYPQRSAHFGWDCVIGFWVEVRADRRIVAAYDALNAGYNAIRPLEGALLFLVEAGFFSHDDLGETLVRRSEELPEEMPTRLRRVAEVIASFRAAAD